MNPFIYEAGKFGQLNAHRHSQRQSKGYLFFLFISNPTMMIQSARCLTKYVQEVSLSFNEFHNIGTGGFSIPQWAAAFDVDVNSVLLRRGSSYD